MKIGQSPEIPTAVSQATSAAQKAPTAAPAASVSATANQGRSAGVAVTVSNLARSLEQSGSASSADFDNKKVETVKAAIQDGSFSVNAEAIADKLLANAQELISRASK